MNFDMYKMMTSDEVVASGINKLSESEQQEILRWGLRMYGLGQHKVVTSMRLNMMEEWLSLMMVRDGRSHHMMHLL